MPITVRLPRWRGRHRSPTTLHQIKDEVRLVGEYSIEARRGAGTTERNTEANSAKESRENESISRFVAGALESGQCNHKIYGRTSSPGPPEGDTCQVDG